MSEGQEPQASFVPLPLAGGVRGGPVAESDDAPAQGQLTHPRPLPQAGGERTATLPLDFLAKSTSFQSDARFAPTAALPQPPQAEPEDPIAIAWADGFAAGIQQAQAEAAEQSRIEAEARAALSLAFTRLDRDLAETLHRRLRDTVAALCEAALAPLALDEDALAARIERAAAMFARADDERVIRLNPDDLALISPRLADDWQVVPDPALPRGGLRVETASGGVEDGPAEWRRAIAEAMALC